MIYSPRAFLLLGRDIIWNRMTDRSFRAHFGCSPDVCSILWEMIDTQGCLRCSGMMPRHLLWTLNFLKAYETEDLIASRMGTTRKTLRKWIWIVLRAIAGLKRRLVRVFLPSFVD